MQALLQASFPSPPAPHHEAPGEQDTKTAAKHAWKGHLTGRRGLVRAASTCPDAGNATQEPAAPLPPPFQPHSGSRKGAQSPSFGHNHQVGLSLPIWQLKGFPTTNPAVTFTPATLCSAQRAVRASPGLYFVLATSRPAELARDEAPSPAQQHGTVRTRQVLAEGPTQHPGRPKTVRFAAAARDQTSPAPSQGKGLPQKAGEARPHSGLSFRA